MKKINQSGFSLIELVVVSSLLLAVAAIAFPMAGTQYERTQMTKFGSQLEYFLKQARMTAMEKGKNVSLCHQSTADREFLAMQLQDSTATTACDGVRYKTMELPYQEQMRFDSTALNGHYDPRGKYQYATGQSSASICIDVQQRSFIRFSLRAFGLEQSRGKGTCS